MANSLSHAQRIERRLHLVDVESAPILDGHLKDDKVRGNESTRCIDRCAHITHLEQAVWKNECINAGVVCRLRHEVEGGGGRCGTGRRGWCAPRGCLRCQLGCKSLPLAGWQVQGATICVEGDADASVQLNVLCCGAAQHAQREAAATRKSRMCKLLKHAASDAPPRVVASQGAQERAHLVVVVAAHPLHDALCHVARCHDDRPELEVVIRLQVEESMACLGALHQGSDAADDLRWGQGGRKVGGMWEEGVGSAAAGDLRWRWRWREQLGRELALGRRRPKPNWPTATRRATCAMGEQGASCLSQAAGWAASEAAWSDNLRAAGAAWPPPPPVPMHDSCVARNAAALGAHLRLSLGVRSTTEWHHAAEGLSQTLHPRDSDAVPRVASYRRVYRGFGAIVMFRESLVGL